MQTLRQPHHGRTEVFLFKEEVQKQALSLDMCSKIEHSLDPIVLSFSIVRIILPIQQFDLEVFAAVSSLAKGILQ